MTISRILIFVALVLAVVAALIGFDFLEVAVEDEHLAGWVASSLAAYYASLLVRA